MWNRRSSDRTVSVGKLVEFSFNENRIKAVEGESLTAALASADVLSLRTDKEGRPRGTFCGMGICFDCLVVVDGKRSAPFPANDGLSAEFRLVKVAVSMGEKLQHLLAVIGEDGDSNGQ